MKKHLLASLAATAAIALTGTAVPHSAAAQSAPQITGCVGGTAPVVETRVDGARQFTAVDPFVGRVTFAFLRTTTTTTNYKGVRDLIQTVIRDESGTLVSYSYPAYLLAAYGGDIPAIQRDLESGFLHDRGPCS